MDNAGNIYLNVFTGHGNQDCNSYEVRFYEFFIYTDIVDEPNFDQIMMSWRLHGLYYKWRD